MKVTIHWVHGKKEVMTLPDNLREPLMSWMGCKKSICPMLKTDTGICIYNLELIMKMEVEDAIIDGS